MKQRLAICWLRRDLRLHDHAALYHALRKHSAVLPVFIFDRNILDALQKPFDLRVQFIHEQLRQLKGQLRALGSDLCVLYDYAGQAWQHILNTYEVEAVYANHDYEPYARKRDNEVAELLKTHHIPFYTFKDQVIFEKSEVVKSDGTPYSVFTPYARKWKAQLNDFYLRSYPTEKYFSSFLKLSEELPMPSLEAMGFRAKSFVFPPCEIREDIIRNYHNTRDLPALDEGTSRLGVHLRFGTVSIRELACKAQAWNATYLNELIWREFFMMILWHHPRVVTHAFKEAYDHIPWQQNEELFRRWCEGTTGYPLVDAGMRQLNASGYMHNRLRMLTASFLCKHLLIDWRLGEAYFASKLLDYELSSNNGGWQWAAGTGCDAAPYFRIFNPWTQQKKFDPDNRFVSRWVPEWQTKDYPKPVVEHASARERAIDFYKRHIRQT